MDKQLTRQQRDKLFELGVPKEAASVSTFYINNYREYWYYFTVTDLLEILPKEITVKENNHKTKLDISVIDGLWCAAHKYIGFGGSVEYKKSKELIDALYELLVWAIEAGYLKFE